MKRGAPLVWKGRRQETRIMHSGRIILGDSAYTALCWKVWRRDQGLCQINHNEFPHYCWRSLPHFSKRWMDHIIKRSQGAPGDILSNLRLACPPCHDWLDNCGGKLKERTVMGSGSRQEPVGASKAGN
jgi:5-methylcytosine-specific restriction endonuclease McrA